MRILVLQKSDQVVLLDDDRYEDIAAFPWRLCGWGYAMRATRKNGVFSSIYIHRFLLDIHPGDKRIVDHIDGNKLNNQIANLRIATKQQNQLNQRVHARPHTSQYKGVCWWEHKGTAKWLAGIRYQRKKYHLGLFTDEHEAAKAYNKKALELFGEFAQLNVIEQ